MLKKWDLVRVIRLRETPASLRAVAVSQSWTLSREANTHAWPLAYACLPFLILRHVVSQPEGCSCVHDPWSPQPPASSQTTHEWKKELNEAFFLSMSPSACRCLFGVHVCMRVHECVSLCICGYMKYFMYTYTDVYLCLTLPLCVSVCISACVNVSLCVHNSVCKCL